MNIQKTSLWDGYSYAILEAGSTTLSDMNKAILGHAFKELVSDFTESR